MNTHFKAFASYNYSPIYVWFYPCSYIFNYLKMPKKSQINEYSDIASQHYDLETHHDVQLCVETNACCIGLVSDVLG